MMYLCEVVRQATWVSDWVNGARAWGPRACAAAVATSGVRSWQKTLVVANVLKDLPRHMTVC